MSDHFKNLPGWAVFDRTSQIRLSPEKPVTYGEAAVWLLDYRIERPSHAGRELDIRWTGEERKEA
jgi:hypothetical protein